jgi:predicted nucleic acid-binding Zn ribbon protein
MSAPVPRTRPRSTEIPSNASASLHRRWTDEKPLPRPCYLCRPLLGAQRFSVMIYDERASLMGRYLVCLDCLIRHGLRGPHARTLTCTVCGLVFIRFYRVGFRRQITLNGGRRVPTTVCSSTCEVRRRRQRAGRILEPRPCAVCGLAFVGRRDARVCSGRCRVRQHRRARAAVREDLLTATGKRV